MNIKKKFTVVEVVVAILLLSATVAGVLIVQNQVEKVDRDRQRKTAINTMHYSLQEVYFPKNRSYPKTIDEKTLPSTDPAFFTDPRGNKIGTQQSDYAYLPLACEANSCRSYILRTKLENEVDFVRRPED